MATIAISTVHRNSSSTHRKSHPAAIPARGFEVQNLQTMKKLLSLFVAPVLAGCVVAAGLHTFIGYSIPQNMDMLTTSGTDTAFMAMGFVFGFLPCFIYGLALSTLADMAGKDAAPATPPQADILPALYVGQYITAPDCNCAFRVKSVNVRAILEHLNPEYSDYL